MKNYTVRPYQKNDYEDWNAFIGQAKNATFLFHRDFMEYHNDRFEDYSLIVLDGEKWVAVLPANVVGNMVFSHQGLTYGGLVLNNRTTGNEVNLIFHSIIAFLKNKEFKKLFIKPILAIYNKSTSYELDAFLIQEKGVLYRKDLNLAINFKSDFQVSKSKLKHFRKICKLELEIKEDTVFDDFWNQVLIPRLKEKYEVSPVHSLEEMKYLKNKFPKNILQYNVYFENVIIAGITIFKFDGVIKSQYGATTKKGEELRALDYLFIKLIQKYEKEVSFFDMGTVTDESEKGYNLGLLKQKEELGCSIFNQDFYSLSL